jgi:hypothetical protein
MDVVVNIDVKLLLTRLNTLALNCFCSDQHFLPGSNLGLLNFGERSFMDFFQSFALLWLSFNPDRNIHTFLTEEKLNSSKC